MSDYYVLKLNQVSDAAEDWLSVAAFESGALGMSEALAFTQPEGEEDVFTHSPTSHAVDLYFAAPPDPDFLEDLRSRYPEIVVEGRSEIERDWLAEWKKGYKPFSLIGDHWVVPTWCEPPPEALHRIWIDPGMAFGTGTHETTQLMAEALLRISIRDQSVLDVGTGTGILAILARQLGATRVVATELEANSRRVAREIFAANDCDAIEMDHRQVEDLVETFDVVMANIIDGVLVRIQDALTSRLLPGGWLVLSGIIAEREPDFLAGMKIKTWPLRLVRGDWRLFATQVN